ncbi:MAG: YhjD/YihY/BrkB family envelope integrity protein, partial [Actinomycetota bacterium]|nr:YhjD/YihY/BrkB family envelope integrity protein [Actinomycetota bacterium]
SVVLVSLVLNTALTALIAAFGLDDWLVVGATLSFVTRIGATLLIIGGLAVMYRSLPYMTVPWRAAMAGAIAATFAGWIVSHVVGAYLSRFGTVSVESAAGGVAAILAWIYMLSQIVLAGAQLTNTLTLRARSDAVSSASGGVSAQPTTPR